MDFLYSTYCQVIGIIVFAGILMGLKMGTAKLIKKPWYIFLGRRTNSLLCHGIALACEEIELEEINKDNPLDIRATSHWRVNLRGQGTLETPKYCLFTNSNGSTSMRVQNALEFEIFHKSYAENVLQTLISRNDGIQYQLSQKHDGGWVISIEGIVSGNAKEKDARYYIKGFYEEVIESIKIEENSKYLRYKHGQSSK